VLSFNDTVSKSYQKPNPKSNGLFLKRPYETKTMASVPKKTD